MDFDDQERRNRLTKLYNEKFNSIRNREFDGSHLTFDGMNTDIKTSSTSKECYRKKLVWWQYLACPCGRSRKDL